MKLRNMKGHLTTLAISFLAIYLEAKFDPFKLR